MRVAAGAIARKYLRGRYGVEIRGYLAQLGPIRPTKVIWDEVDNNPFFCPDPTRSRNWKLLWMLCANPAIPSERG
jgi:chorismate synthase